MDERRHEPVLQSRSVLLPPPYVRLIATTALIPLLIGLGAGCREEREAPTTNVLLITVGSLRPSAMGWVSADNETPAIDALATGGFRFPAAVSPSPVSLPAHVSILTGLIPRRHRVLDDNRVLGEHPSTIADLLRQRGYATAALVGGRPLWASTGIDRGFDLYDANIPAVQGRGSAPSAQDVTTAALGWLKNLQSRPDGDCPPWFLWVHFSDLRLPGVLPSEGLVEIEADYFEKVKVIDRAIASLETGIAGLGLSDGLLTVLTADHGASLGRHGEEDHGLFVYDSSIRVPLIVRFPEVVTPGLSVAPVSLIDVLPTVLDFVGMEAPGNLDGVSLRATLESKEQALPPAYVECWHPWLGYGWSPVAAILDGKWKLIVTPRPELYDLARDPEELDNLFEDDHSQVLRLAAWLHKELEADRVRELDGSAESKLLEGLCLVAQGAVHEDQSLEPLVLPPDPKNRLEVKQVLDRADAAFREGRFSAALPVFQAVHDLEPGNRMAALRVGNCLVRLDRADEAIPYFELVVGVDPDQPEARYALADALTRRGENDRAIEQWSELTRRRPRVAVGWSNLALVLARMNRLPEAVEALAQAVALDPANSGLVKRLAQRRYQLARSEAETDRMESALRELGLAVAAEPLLRARAAGDPVLAPLLADLP